MNSTKCSHVEPARKECTHLFVNNDDKQWHKDKGNTGNYY